MKQRIAVEVAKAETDLKSDLESLKIELEQLQEQVSDIRRNMAQDKPR
jgi:chaperonin cofactor prefoldin